MTLNARLYYDRYFALLLTFDSENSNCTIKRGHLSNSWDLLFPGDVNQCSFNVEGEFTVDSLRMFMTCRQIEMTSVAKCNGRPAAVVIRAARANDDFIDVEIREYQRREHELRQSRIAAAAARASTSSSAESHNVNILRNNTLIRNLVTATASFWCCRIS